MQHRLPADVPKGGERYDLTLTGAGLDRRKREIVMFVIDNGPYKGVQVSAVLISQVKRSFIDDADVPESAVDTRSLDRMKYGVRLSAKIDVQRTLKNPHTGLHTEVADDYKATNVYVHYDLTEWAFAHGESELAVAFERKEGKFARKNSDPVPPAEKPAEKSKTTKTRKTKAGTKARKPRKPAATKKDS